MTWTSSWTSATGSSLYLWPVEWTYPIKFHCYGKYCSKEIVFYDVEHVRMNFLSQPNENFSFVLFSISFLEYVYHHHGTFFLFLLVAREPEIITIRIMETYFLPSPISLHSLKGKFFFKFSHIYSWGRPATITPFVYEGKHTNIKNVWWVEWWKEKKKFMFIYLRTFAAIVRVFGLLCLLCSNFERSQKHTFSTSLCREHLKFMIWIKISIFVWMSLSSWEHCLLHNSCEISSQKQISLKMKFAFSAILLSGFGHLLLFFITSNILIEFRSH